MNDHQLFADHADLYARIRPLYPQAVYDYLAQVTPCRSTAWDCACGSGQVACDLARYFERVEATDVSGEQISQAPPIDGVRYSVTQSESTSFDDHAFDLVCVGQALHWFDYDRFWPELDRVLKPGGAFAAWGYIFPHMNAEIDAALATTLYPVIQPYWSPRNRLLWDHYRNVAVPYQRLAAPQFTFAVQWNLAELLAYIHTWSAVRRCMNAVGEQFFLDACAGLRGLWGEAAKRHEIKMDFCFLAARKDSD